MASLEAIHIGMSGFPFGSAAVSKCIAVYSSIRPFGIDVLAINCRPKHAKGSGSWPELQGQVEGVKYVYTTPRSYKSESFFRRRYDNLVGQIGEFFLIVKLGLKGKIQVAFFYPDGSFMALVYYRLLSLVLRFPIVAHYVELRSSFTSRNRIDLRIEDWLFDKYFTRLVDGVLPISEHLINHLASTGNSKPILKVPPMTDFRSFAIESPPAGKRYFLYVGSGAYLSDIRFILNCFSKLSTEDANLHLVVHGTASEMKDFHAELNSRDIEDRVIVFTKLQYSKLVEQYMGAYALLIPLQDTLQNRARFPQKIAEYAASKRPIITTQVGEVSFYFRHMQTAFMASSYSELEYSEMMRIALHDEEMANQVGYRGYELGRENFSYEVCGSKIASFIKQIAGA